MEAHTQPCGMGSETEEDEYGRSVETVLMERLAEGLLKHHSAYMKP